MVPGGRGREDHRAQRHDARHHRPRRPARRAHRPAQGCDGRGFVFYTNYESRKGRELDANPRATLLFPWVAMERQITVEGPVVRVTREESEAYFHSRPRQSQLAAWASPQSTAVAGRAVIEESYRVIEKKYEGREVPLPPKLGRVPAGARDGRVLAGPAQPPARPAALPPRDRRRLGG